MPNNKMTILFQNADFIAVEKPAGISVHDNEDPTNLLTSLEAQLKIPKLYPVHRLDKETSGVQVVALHQVAARELAEEFQSRTVQKIYVGLLRGVLKSQSGTWTQSLSDKGEGRKNPAGLSGDRVQCETQFRLLKSNKYFSLCEFKLITGRQHQIRKHAAMANHSIVGDGRYGDKNYNKKMSEYYGTERMFLHCQKIEIKGQTIVSPLPTKFEEPFDSKDSPSIRG